MNKEKSYAITYDPQEVYAIAPPPVLLAGVLQVFPVTPWLLPAGKPIRRWLPFSSVNACPLGMILICIATSI